MNHIPQPEPEAHCSTREDNYIFESWWVVSEVGDLARSLLVNAHRFNTVPADDIDERVESIIGRLRQFQRSYRIQYKQTDIRIER